MQSLTEKDHFIIITNFRWRKTLPFDASNSQTHRARVLLYTPTMTNTFFMLHIKCQRDCAMFVFMIICVCHFLLLLYSRFMFLWQVGDMVGWLLAGSANPNVKKVFCFFYYHQICTKISIL
jgi:hypothetical protein